MMTSEIGKRSGFTLIEMMVVIFILTMLAAVLVGNIAFVGNKAKTAATKAILLRISLGVDKYKDLTGFYPADGLDSVVKADQGRQIFASQCLYKFLGKPLIVKKQAPGGRIVVERYSSPILQFKNSEIDIPLSVDKKKNRDLSVGEIMDAWKTPIHYDRLEGNNSFSIEDEANMHLNPPPYHPPDPREMAGFSVKKQGPQNPGEYDIWSHGAACHLSPEEGGYNNLQDLVRETIGNWEMPKLRSE